MRRLVFALLIACKREPPASAEGGAGTCSSVEPCGSGSASESGDRNAPKKLENTCAELRVSAKKTVGRVVKDGSVYGTNVAFTREVYYGSAGKGAELELIDNTPILEDKYKQLWIKVRVICNSKDPDVQGRIGWIDMTDTSFSDAYNPGSKKIEL